MIEQNVRVVRFRDGEVWVRLGAQSGCRSCENGQGCGAGLFAKLFRGKPVILVLPEKALELRTGQMLVLGIPESLYLRLVWATYGLPLLAALAGAMAGLFLAGGYGLGTVQTDLIVLMAGLLAAWLTLRQTRRRMHSGKVRHWLQSLEYYPASETTGCDPLSSRPTVTD